MDETALGVQAGRRYHSRSLLPLRCLPQPLFHGLTSLGGEHLLLRPLGAFSFLPADLGDALLFVALLLVNQRVDLIREAAITRAMPDPLCDVGRINLKDRGTNNCGMFLPVSPFIYTCVRMSAYLCGDIYNTCKQLLETELMELADPVSVLNAEANRFRTVRNFFTHIDERLFDFEKHGVCGPHQSDCGLEYFETTKDATHLILQQNTLYFTDNKECHKIDMGRDAFAPLFEKGRLVLREIMSHDEPVPSGGPTYPEWDRVYL